MELPNYILNSRRTNKIVDDFLKSFSFKYDIKKSFDSKIISEISLQEFLKNHNDGEYEYVFIYGIKQPNDVCLAILGRKEENEMEEDEEFDTHLLYSVPQITSKKQLIKLLVNSKPNTYSIIVLSLYKCIKKDTFKMKYRDNTNYLFEKKKQERYEKAILISYLKIVDKVFGSINTDISKIDDSNYLKELLEKSYLEIYEKLYPKKYVKQLISINEIKIPEFEYDLKRNKLYVEIRLIYKYIEDNNPRIDKYNTLMPNIKSIQFKPNADVNLIKKHIFNAILIKSLVGFGSLFRYLFLNQDIRFTLNNLDTNRIPEELYSIIPNIKVYKSFLN